MFSAIFVDYHVVQREQFLPYLGALLRPLVRFVMGYSCSYQDFVFAAKRAFIVVAEQELEKLKVKVNTTRISAMTGLNRNDVALIRESSADAPERPLNVLGRVIARWQRDGRFLTKSGKPRILECGGEFSEFAKLVKLESRHAHASSMLFELERIGAVERSEKGVQLKVSEYLSENIAEVLTLLIRDLEGLLSAVDQNMRVARGSCLHLHTEYDNVNPDVLPQVRDWIREEGKAFHKRVREHLAQFDLDVTPLPPGAKRGQGGRVMVGAFHFQSDIPTSRDSQSP